jgi:hypothetical protein
VRNSPQSAHRSPACFTGNVMAEYLIGAAWGLMVMSMAMALVTVLR